jgi:hypothetical protein
MRFAHDEQVVQAFSPQRADQPLDVAVRLGLSIAIIRPAEDR